MHTHCWPLATAIALSLAGLALPAATAHAQPRTQSLQGAIFTSTIDHSVVNGNIYQAMEDVYLNGGPNNANCRGGQRLPDGDYYFQVTDPSGKELLSTMSAPWERSFRISGGVIISNLGDQAKHPSGGTSHCGSLAIRLFPYNFTPNPGGVYKAWITRKSDYETVCGIGVDCGLAGFVERSSKTDNFKVRDFTPPVDPPDDEEPPPEEPEFTWIKAVKYYDANANGVLDAGDTRLDGWEMTLVSERLQASITTYTRSFPTPNTQGIALWSNAPVSDDYYIFESPPLDNPEVWVNSGTAYTGNPDGSPKNPAGPLVTEAGGDTYVWFGNYCTVGTDAWTLNYWKHQWWGGNAFDALAPLLPSMWTRDALGNHVFVNRALMFQSTWAADALSSPNLAHRLSAQMVALNLNLVSGRISGGFHHAGSQMSAQELADAANALLAGDGTLYVGMSETAHPLNATMRQLLGWITSVNEGARLVPSEPCPYRFY